MNKYAADERPCLVAKKKCGHYVAACALWPRGLQVAADFAVEMEEHGAILEIRPASFVRSGGLTFDCTCEAGGVETAK